MPFHALPEKFVNPDTVEPSYHDSSSTFPLEAKTVPPSHSIATGVELRDGTNEAASVLSAASWIENGSAYHDKSWADSPDTRTMFSQVYLTLILGS